MIMTLSIFSNLLYNNAAQAKSKETSDNPKSILYGRFDKPTNKEIEKVLNLKTKDYTKLTLKRFRNQAIEALSKDDIYAAFEKIKVYLSENSDNLDLKPDELIFLKYTLPCTYSEEIYANYDKKKIPSIYNRINKRIEEQGEKGSITETDCSIEYCVSYTIKDDTKYTVAQRENIIISINNEMESYIDTLLSSPITNVNEINKKLLKKLNDVVNENSNSEMKLIARYISI